MGCVASTGFCAGVAWLDYVALAGTAATDARNEVAARWRLGSWVPAGRSDVALHR
jgi:hypothetical protein